MVLFWGVVDEIFELLDEVLPTFEFGFIVDGATEELSDEDRVPPLNLEFRSLRAFEEDGILLLVRFFFEGDNIVIGGETNCPWFFFIDDQSPTDDIVESSHAVDSVVVHVSPNPNFCWYLPLFSLLWRSVSVLTEKKLPYEETVESS